MLPYFKGYTIWICVIAVALPVITSTVWPLFTGQMMASSITGLALMIGLFIIGMLIGYAIFNKLADAKVQEMLNAYDDRCDPGKFIVDGGKIASQISFPCNQAASWFMGYYGQALLDDGRSSEAKNIANGLRMSIDSAKTPKDKAGILVNYLALDQKIDGIESALSLAEEGLGYCDHATGGQSEQFESYLQSQKKILEDLASPDPQKAVEVCDKIRQSSSYPMRLRVEYSWLEAARLFGSSDKSKELECLEFIVQNGNKLALVAAAKSRLSSL